MLEGECEYGGEAGGVIEMGFGSCMYCYVLEGWTRRGRMKEFERYFLIVEISSGYGSHSRQASLSPALTPPSSSSLSPVTPLGDPCSQPYALVLCHLLGPHERDVHGGVFTKQNIAQVIVTPKTSSFLCLK